MGLHLVGLRSGSTTAKAKWLTGAAVESQAGATGLVGDAPIRRWRVEVGYVHSTARNRSFLEGLILPLRLPPRARSSGTQLRQFLRRASLDASSRAPNFRAKMTATASNQVQGDQGRDGTRADGGTRAVLIERQRRERRPGDKATEPGLWMLPGSDAPLHVLRSRRWQWRLRVRH